MSLMDNKGFSQRCCQSSLLVVSVLCPFPLVLCPVCLSLFLSMRYTGCLSIISSTYDVTNPRVFLILNRHCIFNYYLFSYHDASLSDLPSVVYQLSLSYSGCPSAISSTYMTYPSVFLIPVVIGISLTIVCSLTQDASLSYLTSIGLGLTLWYSGSLSVISFTYMISTSVFLILDRHWNIYNHCLFSNLLFAFILIPLISHFFLSINYDGHFVSLY